MPYADDLRAHLERYKVETLGVERNGLWRGRSCAHILPDDDRFLNILDPFREDFRSCVQAGRFTFSLADLPHLNSSLAMCINLVLPFVSCGWYSPLLASIEVDPEPIERAEFETVMPDRTHVDVLLEGQSERRLFFEIKLKETGFGPANDSNADYQQIFDEHRQPLELLVEEAHLTMENFTTHYQLFRYLSFISPKNSDIFCLVVPRRNEQFGRAISFICQALRATIRQRVKIAYLEDVIERLLASTQYHERFQRHFDLFKRKYVSF